ncbi:uncharacterized protein LOC117251134 [Epinephelus lanceolatus]
MTATRRLLLKTIATLASRSRQKRRGSGVGTSTVSTDLLSKIVALNRKENQSLELFSSQESLDDADATCERGLLLNKIQTLEKENAKLWRENSHLRTSVVLFDKLPDLLDKVQALSGAIEGVQQDLLDKVQTLSGAMGGVQQRSAITSPEAADVL